MAGPELIPGSGELSRRIREHDWASTPLGPIESWPASLLATVRLLLGSRYPSFVWWGPRFIQVYNDAYASVLGPRHPRALGMPAPEIWSDIWDVIGPQGEAVVREGASTWNEQLLLQMERHGFREETYFTFSYSPARKDDGSIAGVYCTCTEDTRSVLGARRLRTLREIAASTANVRTTTEACALAVGALEGNRHCVPFAQLYLIEAERPRLVAQSGLAHEPATGWPLDEVVRTGQPVVLRDAKTRYPGLPGGPWPESCRTVALQPIAHGGTDRLAGILVAGVSPRLVYDDEYRGFLDLVAGSIGTALAAARASEEERRRLDALAELDRAKSAFFANVSHEFRTPLTLLLGPLGDLLASEELSASTRETIAMARRNALRLQKLVNALLDFSRIEAGRARVSRDRVDLSQLTTDLASAFRSLVERAGLRLVVTCPPVGEVVVDRDAWEKIVLNLLSNAFKFTFEGELEVALADEGERVVLTVRDTGVGIPAASLPHVFERFHRVEGQRGRTFEGSGIGLALVAELVKLHDGTVSVASTEGRGTTFTVAIPRRSLDVATDAAPPDRTARADSFVEEALRWLPDEDAREDAGLGAAESVAWSTAAPRSLPLVLVADDNADVREYVRRILATEAEVVATPDGDAALAAARARVPDVVLSDVMMPRLDGFGLLRELRADARTRTVPVILLSARAGEESKVEGLEAGADDYLVKPFGSRELVARVRSHAALARARRELDRRKDEFLAMLAHELRNPLAPIANAVQLLRHRTRTTSGLAQPIDVIARQSEHLARLVDDLLDVSRITRGKIRLDRRPIDAATLVERALEITRPVLDARRHRVEVHLARPVPWVEGDATRLAQVLANLLNNAAKFTPDHGRVSVAVESSGRSIEFRVKDDGVGISAEDLNRVFDLFAQGPTSLDRSQGGLGIGLTIVRGLVELHGGAVRATSDGPGRGAEFVVRLPAVSPAVFGDPGDDLHHAERGLRVLVVDDNHDAATTLKDLLEAYGHETAVAFAGDEALRLVDERRPDVVLLDLGLPGLDGYEVARRVRSSPASSVRLVALTGYGQEDDRRRAREAGFDDFLVKPADLGALVRVLAQVPSPKR